MNRPRRSLLATAVLPLMVIVGFQSAWAAYACRIDGKVRDHCCCKAARHDKGAPADDAARMKPQGCCEVSISKLSRAPEAREAAQVASAPPDVTVSIASTPLLPLRVERVLAGARDARAPPRIPIFLDKQAILR